MSRGKLKFDWSVYSARRKVSIQLLQEKGIVKDYTSYVAYCDEMSVSPMTEPDFVKEFTPLTQPTTTPPPESPTIEATVWLAGVKDEQPATSTGDTMPPSKKKKARDPVPGATE